MTQKFFLFPITGILTERDELAVGSVTATFSTCPSSTTFEFRTPPRPAVVLADAKPATGAPNQRSLVPQEAFHRMTTFS